MFLDQEQEFESFLEDQIASLKDAGFSDEEARCLIGSFLKPGPAPSRMAISGWVRWCIRTRQHHDLLMRAAHCEIGVRFRWAGGETPLEVLIETVEIEEKTP